MARGLALRDGKKEATWRRHVRAQAGSGQSVVAYCLQHGLRDHGFYWWRRELARRDGQKPAAFVPVTVAAPIQAGAGRIEIILSGGRRVRVVGPVDRGVLGDVLAVLEDRTGADDRQGERGC